MNAERYYTPLVRNRLNVLPTSLSRWMESHHERELCVLEHGSKKQREMNKKMEVEDNVLKLYLLMARYM